MKNSLDKMAVKAMATTARKVAKESENSLCFFFIHQPEEPKDMALRLKEM